MLPEYECVGGKRGTMLWLEFIWRRRWPSVLYTAAKERSSHPAATRCFAPLPKRTRRSATEARSQWECQKLGATNDPTVYVYTAKGDLRPALPAPPAPFSPPSSRVCATVLPLHFMPNERTNEKVYAHARGRPVDHTTSRY